MTTIILVIIGILLAAAAALMALFYGGDVFNAGDAKAEAATAINAGINVESATKSFIVEKARPPRDIDELVSSDWLSDDMGLGDNAPSIQDFDEEKLFLVSGLSEDACSNVNAEFGYDGVLNDRTGRRGCWDNEGSYTYYISLSGASPEEFNFEWYDGYREPDWSDLPYSNASAGDFGSRTAGPSVMRAGMEFTSPNGRFTVRMQYDGNLVLYDNGVRYWDAASALSSGFFADNTELRFQNDTNIVLYDENEDVVWAKSAFATGNGIKTVYIQNDGNLVFYHADFNPIWASNTNR